jgi:tRNA G46 methylase TrmB
MVNQGLVEGLCEILVPGGTVAIKTDNKPLFEDMDALLSARLEMIPSPAIPPAGGMVLTEWEEECMRKSIPVYAREYRLR